MKLLQKLTLILTLLLSIGIFAACTSKAETVSNTEEDIESETIESSSQESTDELGASEADTESVENKLIKVGVCPGPYGDMFLEAIAPSLEELGYEVEVIEFSDYVQPNLALANGEIDVNLFQHTVYLEKFSQDNNLDLTMITLVPTASIGVFSDSISSLEELADSGKVSIANDATNLSRALRVLQQADLITIDPEVDPASATELDLSENPYGFEFVLVEAAQLPRTLDSVELAVVNGNYAIAAGLNLADALYNEVLDESYINGIAVRSEDADSQLASDILSVVKSDAFKEVIENPEGQYVSFQKPSDY